MKKFLLALILATLALCAPADAQTQRGTSAARARQIMGGQNFFGLQEAMKYFKIDPQLEEILFLSHVPFSEEKLKACKDSHILVAVFPISIIEIRSAVAGIKLANGQPLFYKQNWHGDEEFATDKSGVAWHLVRKDYFANSTSKTWKEQQALLPEDEETPKARILVYLMVGHMLATGEYLFGNSYVRSADIDSGGDRIFVGRFDANGLEINSGADNISNVDIGVASAKKK